MAVPGYAAMQRLAQSYLGALWVAVEMDGDEQGELRLLRRLQLPAQTPDLTRLALIQSAEEARQLRHEQVLGVIGVIEQGQELTLAYEHVEAEPLRSLQSWANLRSLSFPVSVSLKMVCDLLRGAAAVHQTYAGKSSAVFGGLSPDSMLVARDGRTLLCDPLIASRAALVEGIGFNTAKLAYAAPEQVRAGALLSASTDVFTCGAILWELLATRRLLAGSRPALERKLREHDLPSLSAHLRGDQHVSSALVALVDAALAADPEQRPSSALDMAERLARCGHEIAAQEDVAAFVGQLSGQRFDRRSAATRSKLLPQLDAGLTWPIELPTTTAGTRRGARPAALPQSQVSTPRVLPNAEAWAAVASAAPESAGLDASEATTSTHAALAPRPAAPASTLLHVSMPAPSGHFSAEARASGLPLAQPLSSGFPRDCDRPSGHHARAELTLARRIAHAFSPGGALSQRGGALWRAAQPTRRGWLGVVVVVFAVGSAFVLMRTLRARPSAEAKAAAGLPVVSAGVADDPMAVGTPEAPAPIPEAPAPIPEAPAPTAEAPAPTAEPAEASPEPDPRGALPALAATSAAALDAPTLDDSQLVQLFALEPRRQLARCGEQSSGKRTSAAPAGQREAVMKLKAARREMLRGNNTSARLLLCEATRADPANLAASRTLAALALQLGDPALARAALEQALETSTNDPELLGLLGDAKALLGDIPSSRALWLRASPGVRPGAEGTQSLANSYRRIGARLLARSNYAEARNYYRRALVLSAGSFAPSLGLSRALLRLKHTRAGLAWAERAARAFPRDSQIQLLLGDALYRDGQPEKARTAWQAALDVQPKNSSAAQRLKRGKI
jgi:tetratricopeptide (TPR) repeat protein